MEDRLLSDSMLQTNDELLGGHYRMIRQLYDNKSTVVVWLARDLNNTDRNVDNNGESLGKLVSIMICHPNVVLDIEEEQRWQDEFDAASSCHHPNLLPPEEYFIYNDTYYLVFPYTETETLCQLLGKNIPNSVVKKLILDIASGLDELHNHQPPIIHGALMPSNILVFDNEIFVLTNYGIHFETDSQRTDNKDESIAYLAPELFHGETIPSQESDIWAFGATIYEAISGSKPFGDQGGRNQQQNTPIPPLTDQPEEIKDLVYACLQFDPRQRPNVGQIMEGIQSKTPLIPPKKQNRPNKTEKLSKKRIHNKKLIVIVVATVVFVGVLAYLLRQFQHTEKPMDVATKEVIVVDSFEKAVTLLSYPNTAATGLKLLDSLVLANDWQATFLMSRLYFDTRGNDTILYDNNWEKMRGYCNIVVNNEKAHQYLFDAFELNEQDFMILYQLGCDYKAGAIRGCERNLNYALWCFETAENLLNSSNSDVVQFREGLIHGRERISTINYSPVRPSR